MRKMIDGLVYDDAKAIVAAEDKESAWKLYVTEIGHFFLVEGHTLEAFDYERAFNLFWGRSVIRQLPEDEAFGDLEEA